MIDFGATALLGLRQLNRKPSEIRGFAFTHLHGDHVGGFPFLAIDGMFHDVRERLLDIVGPVGVETRLHQVLMAAYGDLATRDRPYDTRMRELFPGGKIEHVGATIHAFDADHMDPPEVPLCLRVESADGKSVAFSGDTAMCDGLKAAAAGADLLVAECSCLAHPCGRHCTWQEWREILPTLGAKRILFTHLGTAVRENVDRLLDEAPEGIDIAFADDGMVLDI